MKTSSIVSILISGVTVGAAVSGYFLFRPSNLKNYLEWKGLVLASLKEENIWKSIYFENKDSFGGFFSNKEGKDEWKVIREYCNFVLPKADYDRDIA